MKKLTLLTAVLLGGLSALAQTDHSVARNVYENQARLQLINDDVKYYNTSDIADISIDEAEVRVNTLRQQQDVYSGNVARISFAKKLGPLDIFEARGWNESAYAKFTLLPEAEDYHAYIKGYSTLNATLRTDYSDWTPIDWQLVRNYRTYGRVDMVGLPAGYYSLRVVPVVNGEECPQLAATTDELQVVAYNRQGFAHLNYTEGVGAYTDYGELKAGARVLYVTKQTARTVKQSVVTNSKGGVTECTGLQAIIDAYQKGYDHTPLAVRFIGLVRADDMDSFSSSEEGIQIKRSKAYDDMDITIEGIGDDATIYGFGFLVRNCQSVEFRNLGIMYYMDDGISVDTDNSNIWIHHVDIFYGRNAGGDKKKGDGSIDVKTNSRYVTIDNCHFWDSGKSSLCGMKSESGPNYITYHNNWFDHSDSRHPRVRSMSVHVYNNYFDEVAKYGVGATYGASIFVESNYFKGTRKPMLSSLQGSDIIGDDGMFSGENGGVIKAYGNYIDRTAKHFSYYTQHSPASTGYDAYEVATRDEQVPATEVARVGGTKYDNFDTDPALMYTYEPVAAADVPSRVTGFYGAGRLNHGDFKYTFADNIGNDDVDAGIIADLEALLKGYVSPLLGFFGEQGGDDTPDDPDDPSNPDNPDNPDNPVVTPEEGVIFCTFDKSGTPSSTFFTVVGNGSNSKGTATVDGQTLTTCLKMESKTSITFTLTQPMVMTLYFGDTETASILIDDVPINGTASTYTTTLQAGQHVLTKDKIVNLFAIKLVPVE